MVRGTGQYQPFRVDKGVDIEATQRAAVGLFEVANVPSGHSVSVSGFAVGDRTLFPLFPLLGGWCTVSSCQGSVLLGSLSLEVGTILWGPLPMAAIMVSSCRSVLIVDTTVVTPQFGSSVPGDIRGLHVSGSQVVVQRCTIAGKVGYGTGGSRSVVDPGSAGVEMDPGSQVLVTASTLVGGAGGMGWLSCGVGSREGGPAIRCVGIGGLVMGGSTLVAGVGGPAVCSWPAGANGPAASGPSR